MLALGTLVPAGSAQACSCAARPAGEALREADAAVVGRLVEVIPRGRLQADYRYRVRRVYRGGIVRNRMLTVRSARRASACALPQRTRHAYGLLLLRGGGRWHGGICGVVRPRQLWAAVHHRARPLAGPCGAALSA